VKTSEKQWSERIEQQRASGKSVAQWCRDQDICYQTFLNWRKRLSQVQVMKSSPFVEIFEESSEPTWMEITTRGAKLVLARKFNRDSLMRLLQVLREL
jgi:hypothetical protein